MLVLSRSKDESIIINDNIKITVIETGKRVRIGIEAPQDIPVHREEVYKAIATANNGQVGSGATFKKDASKTSKGIAP